MKGLTLSRLPGVTAAAVSTVLVTQGVALAQTWTLA